MRMLSGSSGGGGVSGVQDKNTFAPQLENFDAEIVACERVGGESALYGRSKR